MNGNKSILMVGVGGQGTILASKLLTLGLMEEGYDVKMSEIHGMSQRGGSVSSQIRYGKEVQSPVIEPGTADLLVAFEMMEAVRSLEYLKADGKLVVNNYRINPIPVTMGKVKYPERITEYLKTVVEPVIIDAPDEARKAGSTKAMNMVLLGTIIKSMGLEHIGWEKILRENVKPDYAELNLKAIEIGKGLV